MPVETQVLSVAFTQGIDTRAPGKSVIPGKWLQLNNMSTAIEDYPRMRDGWAGLSTTNGNSLALHQNELLSISGNTLSSYSVAVGDLKSATGFLPNVLVSASEFHAGATTISSFDETLDSQDFAISGSYSAAVYRMIGNGNVIGIGLKVADTATGGTVAKVKLAVDANVLSPRIVGDGNGNFLAFWLTSTGTNAIMCAAFSGLNAGGAAGSAIFTNGNIDLKNFDAVLANGVVDVVYRFTAGGISVEAIQVNFSGIVVNAAMTVMSEARVPHANIRGITCVAFANQRVGVFVLVDSASVGAAGIGVVGAVIRNNAWSIWTIATNLNSVSIINSESHITATRTTDVSSNDLLRVFWDQAGMMANAAATISAIGCLNTNDLCVATDVGSISNVNSFPPSSNGMGPSGPYICSKAFTDPDGTTTYVPCFTWVNGNINASAGTSAQNAFFLLYGADFAPDIGVVAASALYGSFGFPTIGAGTPGATPTISTPCGTSMPSAISFVTVVPQTVSALVVSDNPVTRVGLAQLSLTPTGLPPRASPSLPYSQLGPVTFIGGGQLCAYDGARVCEHGFSLFPENVQAAQYLAGSHVTPGVHQFAALYEWYDEQGQRHQSTPSSPVTFDTTSLGATGVGVTVPTLQLTMKPNVTIVVYATTAGGTTFTRANGFKLDNVYNDKTATTVQVNVDVSDATLAGTEALYTQPDTGGATLPNDQPPPATSLCVSQNRLWLLNADSPFQYRYSQEALGNGFGLQFSGRYGDTTLGGLVPSESGGTVAVAPMDEKTIIFCQKKIYVVFGSGPDPAGNNNGLSEPQEVPSDVGCVAAKSVLSMPLGIIFKSQQGWHLLGRDLSVRYIGDGVQAYNNNDVTGATLVLDRKECRFSSTSSSTPVLVLSYLPMTKGGEPVWSTFSSNGYTAMADVAYWSALGAVVHVSTTQGLNKDVPGNFNDTMPATGTVGIRWQAQTSFLPIAKLEGFQRVRRLYMTFTGPGGNAGNVMVSVDFDDQAAGQGPGAYSFTFSTAGATGQDQTADFRHHMQHQKCKSVSFTIVGNPDRQTSIGPMLGFQAIALEVGVKKGVNKLQAGQTVG